MVTNLDPFNLACAGNPPLITSIFNEYLYTPRHDQININELLTDFKTLGNLIHIVAYGKRKTTSSTGSLTGGIRKNSTRKIKTSSIFKRKKFVKRFKKPFLLSLK